MERKKILIADDDLNIQSMLRLCLEADYDVLCAGDGGTALDLATRAHPHLLLLDLAMPVLDGMSVLATLFSSARETMPKVVVMTAHGSVRTALQAVHLGASDFLEKPFTPEDVRSSIASVLNEASHHAADPLASYEEVLSAVRDSIRSGSLGDAERFLMKAGTITDADSRFLNLAGVVHEAHGRYGSARRFYERAVHANPNFEPAQQNLARLTEIEHDGVALDPPVMEQPAPKP